MTHQAGQLEALWSLRQTASHLINASMTRAGYRNVTVGHLRVLEAASLGNDSTEIAHHFGYTQQYISKTIHVCAEAELIDLQPSLADGRRVTLAVTDRGARALRLFHEW